MAKLKKLLDSWKPAENPSLAVGETIEITDYTALVRNGAAVLVDEEGNEIPLPGQIYECPICFKKFDKVIEFTTHIATSHQPKTSKPVTVESTPFVSAEVEGFEETPVVAETTEPVVEDKKPELTMVEKKARRLEILAKAREVKVAKRLAK